MTGTGPAHTLTDLDRTRLRWRARRGLLENDLIISRYLDQHEATLTTEDVAVLTQLFDLPDTDLLDLLLARVEPRGALAAPAVLAVLSQLRAA